MAECRYFPECQRCNEIGDSWIPCMGGSDGTRCEGYEPMPDVDALLAIATMMAADSVRSVKQGISVSPVYILHAARDIAEACGETLGSIRDRELAEWGMIVDREALGAEP